MLSLQDEVHILGGLQNLARIVIFSEQYVVTEFLHISWEHFVLEASQRFILGGMGKMRNA